MLIGIGATAYHRQNILAQILGGAEVWLPITHTAVPQRGSITPTFTRATTETGQKWDEAGYLDFTALAGEIVWKGARRVRNLLTFTEDNTNLIWSQASVTSTTATTVTYGAAKPSQFYYNNTSGIGGANAAIGDVLVAQVLLSGTPGNKINFYIMNGAASRGTALQVTLSATPTLYDITYTATVAEKLHVWLMPDDFLGLTVGTLSQTVTATKWQCENVTGQTTQTASEYVSVGVESAPAYHGSMVDGVKCYDTDRSGNPIPTTGSYPLVGYVPWEARTNVALQGNAFTTAPWAAIGTLTPVQNAIGPDGSTSAWTFTDDNAAATEARYQPITLTAATYTMHVLVGKTTGAQSSYPVLQATDLETKIALCTVDTTNGVATVWTAYTGFTIVTSSARCESYTDDLWKVSLTFLATAAAWYHYLQPAATANATQATGVPDAAVTGSAVFCNFDVELGSFATPYTPTTTVAAARNANVLTYTGADVANIKTLAATFSRGVGVATPGTVVALTDGTANERHTMIFNNATQFFIVGSDGGVNRYLMQPTYTPGTTSKAAVTFATNDVKADFNGTAQTPDTAATMPTVTQINVGHEAGGAVGNCAVNHIYGWTRNLSQSELGAIDA